MLFVPYGYGLSGLSDVCFVTCVTFLICIFNWGYMYFRDWAGWSDVILVTRKQTTVEVWKWWAWL
jgi:hypothetical protein